MSRIGKKAVPLPSGVTAAIEGQTVKIKGPKGALQFVLDKGQEADWFASHVITAVAIARRKRGRISSGAASIARVAGSRACPSTTSTRVTIVLASGSAIPMTRM